MEAKPNSLPGLVVHGPRGCGKTMLLKTLATLHSETLWIDPWEYHTTKRLIEGLSHQYEHGWGRAKRGWVLMDDTDAFATPILHVLRWFLECTNARFVLCLHSDPSKLLPSLAHRVQVLSLELPDNARAYRIVQGIWPGVGPDQLTRLVDMVGHRPRALVNTAKILRHCQHEDEEMWDILRSSIGGMENLSGANFLSSEDLGGAATTKGFTDADRCLLLLRRLLDTDRVDLAADMVAACEAVLTGATRVPVLEHLWRELTSQIPREMTRRDLAQDAVDMAQVLHISPAITASEPGHVGGTVPDGISKDTDPAGFEEPPDLGGELSVASHTPPLPIPTNVVAKRGKGGRPRRKVPEPDPKPVHSIRDFFRSVAASGPESVYEGAP
jgi:hypothetical protein